jgi:hypothetical protein
MPKLTLPALGYAAASLIATYLVLIVVTVSMAAWQTNLAMEVHETEADIARLEARYYDMVADIDRKDPAALGLVAPRAISYAPTKAAPSVTLR